MFVDRRKIRSGMRFGNFHGKHACQYRNQMKGDRFFSKQTSTRARLYIVRLVRAIEYFLFLSTIYSYLFVIHQRIYDMTLSTKRNEREKKT